MHIIFIYICGPASGGPPSHPQNGDGPYMYL